MSTRDLSRADLHTLAAAAGVMVDWVDASDQPRQVSEQSLHAAPLRWNCLPPPPRNAKTACVAARRRQSSRHRC